MKTTIEIKSWLSGKVLFSHTCEGNSIKVTLAAGIAVKANLSYADLRSANLRSANLRSANLRSADLRSANLRSATGNGQEVISFQSLQYSGVYTLEFMWIGCRKHPTKTWW